MGTITALFRDRESAEQALRVCLDRGYGAEDVNFLMSDRTRDEWFGRDDDDSELGLRAWKDAAIGSAVGGTVGAMLAAIAAHGTTVALPGLNLLAVGPMTAALAGNQIGGIIGGLVGSGIPEDCAKVYDEGVRGGGMVLSVNLRTDEDAEFVEEHWREARADAIYTQGVGPRARAADASTTSAEGVHDVFDNIGSDDRPIIIGGGDAIINTGGGADITFDPTWPEDRRGTLTRAEDKVTKKKNRRGGDEPSRPRRGAKQKVAYHFRAKMEDEVLLAHPTVVEVTLSREALGLPTGGAAKEKKIEVSLQKKVVVEVIPMTNFQTVGADTVEVDPAESDGPQSFNFIVRPTHAGEGEVWVMARQGQVSVAQLSLKSRIVEVRGEGGRQVAVEATAPEEEDDLPESLHQLRVYEQKAGGEVWFLFELLSPTLGVFDKYESEPLDGDRQKYVKELYEEIQSKWLRTRDDAVKFAREMRSYGGQLFDRLFPEKLRRILWKHRDEIKSIMVISTEPFIPWEIVHLKDPEQTALPEETKFLGQMGLVRWLHESGWPPRRVKIRKGRARYVIPEYPQAKLRLREAEQERRFLEKEFSAAPVKADSDSVYKIISKPGQFDLLHFACHGYAEQDNISNAGLMLEGRVEPVFVEGKMQERYVADPLTATFAEQNSKLKDADNRPMVVLNACQTAREGYSLTGVGGFAQAFLKSGAGAFVGTLWAVGDSPARTFTEALYKTLRGGTDLAAATVSAREKARAAGDATWLAYSVYGHPSMKLAK